MTLSEKIIQKRTDFAQAFQRFEDVLEQYRKDKESIVLQAALVQYFEIVSELGWKTLRDILLNEGIDEVNTPRTVLKESIVAKYIGDGDNWMQMIEDRNKTSHIYSEKIAQSVLSNIDKEYEKLFNKLKETFDTYEVRA